MNQDDALEQAVGCQYGENHMHSLELADGRARALAQAEMLHLIQLNIAHKMTNLLSLALLAPTQLLK